MLADAHKPSSMSRSFNIQSPAGRLRLEADSAFKGSFSVNAAGVRLATLRAKHLFTRRAVITRRPNQNQPDFATLSFCFWLTVLMWRRAAQNNNS